MLWGFAEIIAKPGMTPGQGLHTESSSSFISTAHSGPEGGNQVQEKKLPFDHGAPGRIRGAHLPVCPSAGWSGVTARRTYQHPLIINSGNTTEILLRADFLPFEKQGARGGYPGAVTCTKCFCGEDSTPNRKHQAQEHRPTYPLRGWPRFKFPFSPSGRASKQSRGQRQMPSGRDIHCRAGSDHTLGPLLRLRAEIVPAGAQGDRKSVV